MSVSLLGGGGGGVWFVVVGCCVLGDMCFRVKKLSSVDWVCVVGRGGGGIMWHDAWDGEGHDDARWRLRRRAAFNGTKGWFWFYLGLSGLLMIFICLLLSFACDNYLVLCFFRP